VEPADRWAIVAYIRALQLAQHADAAALPADVRARIERGAETAAAPAGMPRSGGRP